MICLCRNCGAPNVVLRTQPPARMKCQSCGNTFRTERTLQSSGFEGPGEQSEEASSGSGGRIAFAVIIIAAVAAAYYFWFSGA